MTDAEKLEALKKLAHQWISDCGRLREISREVVTMDVHTPSELQVSANALETRAWEILDILAK